MYIYIYIHMILYISIKLYKCTYMMERAWCPRGKTAKQETSETYLSTA